MKSVITVALIVAAGRGQRFGVTSPKQYVDLVGKPVLRHSLETFALHPKIGAVRVVIHGDDRALYNSATAGLSLLAPVTGGAARQESVRRGLESLKDMMPSAVLIHDAARPLVDAALIDRMLAALEEAPGAIPALPVADTVKRAQDGRVAATLDRRTLWRAQKPPAVWYCGIKAGHDLGARRGRDDEWAGGLNAGRRRSGRWRSRR